MKKPFKDVTIIIGKEKYTINALNLLIAFLLLVSAGCVIWMVLDAAILWVEIFNEIVGYLTIGELFIIATMVLITFSIVAVKLAFFLIDWCVAVLEDG